MSAILRQLDRAIAAAAAHLAFLRRARAYFAADEPEPQQHARGARRLVAEIDALKKERAHLKAQVRRLRVQVVRLRELEVAVLAFVARTPETGPASEITKRYYAAIAACKAARGAGR